MSRLPSATGSWCDAREWSFCRGWASSGTEPLPRALSGVAAVSFFHPLQISFEFLVPTTGQWTNERHKQNKSGRNQREREVGVAVHDHSCVAPV